ncbi:MAG: hypothetical protein HUJ25_05105 [Crocinitomicaceae bacterium]|nr:hypothetical protein [Crocinitomicaceae bacterium]
MIVRIARNYDTPDIRKQTPGNSFEWDGIQFTEEPVEKCDYLVVFNHPKEDFTVNVRKGGTLLLIQEPPYERLAKFKRFIPLYDYVFSDFETDHPGNFRKPAALPWHIGKSYDELKALKVEDLSKDKLVSCVTSNSNMNPGHKPRLDFLDYLNKQEFDFDLMGRGFQPIADKFDGVAPYKYTIAIENYKAENYWTEKIVDCFLSHTMPIYHGCPNITDYFPKESLIEIDINDPKSALEIIEEAIANQKWEKNQEAITHAREKILDEYQFFPFVTKFIREHPPGDEFHKVTIPHYIGDPPPSFFKRLFGKKS